MARIVEAIGRCRGGALSCVEAAEALGMSERHVRRLRERYEADGAEGLIDRRRGRVSGRRVPVDRIEWVPAQYRTRYFDFTAKHFHERLVAEHGLELGYTWTKLTLQRAGLARHAPRRSAHRKRRPRRPLPGMLLFVVPTTASQDGSRHAWLAGRPPLDLIVTLDDATSEIYSAFLVEEEGTGSSFRELAEVIAAPIGGARGPADRGRRCITTGRATAVVIARKGLFCALDTDRDGHYFHTPAAGSIGTGRPRSAGRWRSSASSTSPPTAPRREGGSSGCSGRCRTGCRRRCGWPASPPSRRLNRYLAALFLPAFNARFAAPAAEPGSAFVPYAGAGLADILGAQTERVVGNDNTVRYRRLGLQIPGHRHRRHFVRVKVRGYAYAAGSLAVCHGPRRLGRYTADGAMIDERLAA